MEYFRRYLQTHGEPDGFPRLENDLVFYLEVQKFKVTRVKRHETSGGERVVTLAHVSYISMCRPKGYSCRAVMLWNWVCLALWAIDSCSLTLGGTKITQFGFKTCKSVIIKSGQHIPPKHVRTPRSPGLELNSSFFSLRECRASSEKRARENCQHARISRRTSSVRATDDSDAPSTVSKRR